MAQLIHMRQRIKTVETIKKITHAMRLISMSTHARLSKQFQAIKAYHAAVATLFGKTHSIYPSVFASKTTTANKLLVVIGSQKGLCGSFNSGLFYSLGENMLKNHSPLHIISVGKKATDFIQESYPTQCIASFSQFTPETAGVIAHAIVKRIFQKNNTYTHVSVLSNAMKSFFVQKPHITSIIPVTPLTSTIQNNAEEYLWDTEPQDIIEHITHQYITSSLHSLLLESLLAEHAARFVSMDSSTRNAEKILETTRIKYNKLRQAKITKEIIELADAF